MDRQSRGIFYFGYLLILPLVAVWILHYEGWRVSVWVSLAAAVAIFITMYLRASLLETERFSERSQGGGLLLVAAGVLVGISARFDWQRWIVEQMLLEIAAFSFAIAFVALRKAAKEGGGFRGPWGMVFLIFVFPMVGLLIICGRAWLFSAGGSWTYLGVVSLVGAFLLAAFDAIRKLIPYTLGDDSLSEPFGAGLGIVLLVIWFFALLIGMPMLLSKAPVG